MKDGFITLVGILIAIAIIGIMFVKMNTGTKGSSSEKGLYIDVIDSAKEAKDLLEKNNQKNFTY